MSSHGRRVAVVGASGTGKTTVACRLAHRLGVPYVELDALHHGPNWTEASAEELSSRVAAAMADGGWVIDGNYERKLGNLVLEQADTLVWLDLPLRVALRRLWRRTSTRIRGGVELWHGNRESWRNALLGWESLFVWAIRTHVRMRRTLPRRLEAEKLSHLTLVRLRTEADVERWLGSQDAPPSEPARDGAR